MRWIGGYRQVDLIPNGVDADHYQPGNEPTIPESCVFWGRLDFGPNVDALRWFVKRIWPPIRAARPAATFHLFGFNPTEEVRELVRGPGIELHPDLPDLREEVRRRQVVVLPFMSGGGIKNKLLEAAALGMPVVCTRKALSGTRGNPPMRVAKRPGDWLAALGELWDDAAARAATGAAARQWVIANHTWAAASSAVGY
jgi:glycosyltransferase involved in cell wall biosynthesis